MAEYSRLLELNEEVSDKLRSFLNEELPRSKSERGEFIKMIERDQRDYWAEPNPEPRKFPFKGAANLIIPLAAISVETIHARTMQTAFGLKQIVSAKPVGDFMADSAPAVENALDWELKRMKFKSCVESAILEIEKFGGGVAKTRYEKTIKYGVTTVNGVEQEFPVIKQGCKVESVPLVRFLYPFETENIQDAQWCGEEMTLTPHEIRMLEESEFFFEGTFEAIEHYYENSGAAAVANSSKKLQEDLEHRTPYLPRRIDFCELYLSFDIDNSKRPKEIVVHYHQPTQLFMAVRFNDYPGLRRPYRTGKYFPVEHRLFGIGICKQVKVFQQEVTTQHRQRLDNATLANMRMIKVSKMSGYGPGEPVFPGKMWFLDDMTHIESIQMGEIYPSSQNNEFATLQYAQQRTGVNEATLGMPQAGTPGTATSDLARIQEGAKKFDFTYGNIKEFLSDIIVDVAGCVQKYGPRHIEYYQMSPSGQLVKQWFALPAESITESLVFELTSAGQSGNKMLDRQNWQQVAQILTQYYTLLQQIGQMQPELMQLILPQILQGSTEAVKQILETFDIRNPNRLIVEEFLLGNQQPPGQQLALPPGNAGIINPAQPGSMAPAA